MPEQHVVQYRQKGLWFFATNYELVIKNKYGGVFSTRTYHIGNVEAIDY